MSSQSHSPIQYKTARQLKSAESPHEHLARSPKSPSVRHFATILARLQRGIATFAAWRKAKTPATNPGPGAEPCDPLGIDPTVPRWARIRSEKRPLQRDVPPPTPFPVDALGTVLAGAALQLHEVIQAPVGICGSSVLAATHLAAQPHADVEIDGRVIPLCEFFITVGESGERKSAVDRGVLVEHRAREKRLHDSYAKQLREYKRRCASLEEDLEEAALSSAIALAGRADAPLPEGTDCNPPLAPTILCEEPSLEGFIKSLTVGQPSQGIFSDEGGRFLGGYAMSAEKQLGTLAGLSKLWDGREIDRVRAGDGVTKIYGRRVSAHLMGQPGVIDRLLADPIAQAQGFLSRCLVVVPESTIGTRFYREADLAASGAMASYHVRMRELLEREPKVEDARDPIRRSQLAPRRLLLTGAAKAIYTGFHDEIERRMVGDLRELRAFANKIPEHMLRIAGALALVENVDAADVSGTHAASARTLAEYYLAEAHRLNELACQDPELTLAQRLLEWLQALDRPASLVEIYQLGPNPLRSAERARRVVAILIRHGYLEPVKGIRFGGRVRSEGWRLIH